jgi:hypothetical protein
MLYLITNISTDQCYHLKKNTINLHILWAAVHDSDKQNQFITYT